MIAARFEGGPFDGEELIFVAGGAPPGYVMLMKHPVDKNYRAPIVVGADFDDDWPGQQRYELGIIFDSGPQATAIYRHVEAT